jgi:hypothetical protein
VYNKAILKRTKYEREKDKMKANTKKEAWQMADQIFPTDYMKDEGKSERAGYDVYISTAKDHDFFWISDLGNRLEVNMDGKSVSIWIEEEEQGEDIEVTVSVESGESRTYPTYAEYRKEFRFFFSAGKRYDDLENHFEKMIKALRAIDSDEMKMETLRNGQTVTFKYNKWSQH